MDMDLDQRLSREELTQATRRYNLFEEYDLNKDGLLSKAEIEKEPVADIARNHRKQLLFEPLKKFDLNQDGKLALLEMPPYLHLQYVFWPGRGGGERPKENRPNEKTRYTPEQIARYRKMMAERATQVGNPGISKWSEINDNLMDYNKKMGRPASSLQDLVDAGYYDSLNDLPSPPSGTEWPSKGASKRQKFCVLSCIGQKNVNFQLKF